jgi:hypothetical protein
MGDPGFLKALDELRALHLSKGFDYADASDPLKNYVQSAADGGVEPWRAAFLRLSEKYHRFCNLVAKDAAPNHESLDDTLMDLAAMSLIVRSLRARNVAPPRPLFGASYHDGLMSAQGDGDDGA